MFNFFKRKKKSSENSEVETFLNETNLKCKELSVKLLKNFELCEYSYDIEKSIKELDLEKELIQELIQEYILQIINNKALFIQYINDIDKAEKNNKNPDYTPLRNLAHKNLGVARNLDLDDAKKILLELKTNESIECLLLFAELLEVTAIRLNPQYAYSIIKLDK